MYMKQTPYSKKNIEKLQTFLAQTKTNGSTNAKPDKKQDQGLRGGSRSNSNR